MFSLVFVLQSFAAFNLFYTKTNEFARDSSHWNQQFLKSVKGAESVANVSDDKLPFSKRYGIMNQSQPIYGSRVWRYGKCLIIRRTQDA